MNILKQAVRSLVRKTGHDIVRYPSAASGPLVEIGRYIDAGNGPVIFDVGANMGQTVKRFKDWSPSSRIHAFEPSPRTHSALRDLCKQFTDVACWNVGVGSKAGRLPFFENSSPDMSSFLQLSEFGWGNIEKTLEVDVVTLDDFALRNNIEHVDVLKSDTQGFDAEVLKGSSRLFSENRVSMVLLEIIFSDMYKEGAKFDQVFRLLTDQGFLLVDFYDPGYQEGVLSWSDALFVHSKCHARLLRHTT